MGRMGFASEHQGKAVKDKRAQETRQENGIFAISCLVSQVLMSIKATTDSTAKPPTSQGLNHLSNAGDQLLDYGFWAQSP